MIGKGSAASIDKRYGGYAASTISAVAGFEALRDLVQQNLIIAVVFARRTIEPGMET
jgi:hypothetical protein